MIGIVEDQKPSTIASLTEMIAQERKHIILFILDWHGTQDQGNLDEGLSNALEGNCWDSEY
jgi:hypothetical protein